MDVINDKIERNIVFIEDVKLHGMIVGSTTVSKNATLFLHGMIKGDLILEDNSKVYLHGMVNGDVIAKSGHIEVYGMINGKIIRENGEVIIDPKAIIEKGVLNVNE